MTTLKQMLTVIDYGIGNIGSVVNMVKKIGADVEIATTSQQVNRASKLVLAGIGSFDANITALRASGLDEAILDVVGVGGVPLLGVCLGMQIMCNSSEEGSLSGLGLVDAHVKKFQFDEASKLKVPHMGWNSVSAAKKSCLFDETAEENRFYFCHSYFVDCADISDIALYTTFGLPFVSGFSRGNLYGVQFHPEKSHKFGMTLFKNFLGV